MPAAVLSATNLHLLSRYPIFTAAKTVWGYEIQATASIVPDQPLDPERVNVGAAVIAGDYIGLNTILARNKKMLLSYTREQLQNQIPYAFPAQSSAILISPDFQNDPDLLPALKQMAADGHTIALEWNAGVTPLPPLMELADVICLGTPDMAEELAKIPLVAKTVIVRNVTTREEVERLQSLGISLFQGRFFKTAEIIPGKKLSSHQNSRLQILRIIEAESPDLDQLARTIQADVSLSYRLLTYLNSPTFGFMRKIDSIRQAITLLGWINVRNWLRAVLLADIAQGEEQTELLHLSLRRGKFLEQTVAGHDYWDFKPDEMFLLGMFSLLDAILGIPMADALAFLPLNDAQKKALRGESTTEYMPLLTLMLAFEDQGENAPDRILMDLNLERETMRRLHREAGAWASSILEIGQGA
ncbi:EAL and modified HD-GYP domain-containing signal transduction protein [Desulfomicrobium apsheronum]|uniref:EAL and modified HD-GYP domain-containing signal transduction protein n=1 Tax=Desulfomicrobium apsheronum TaxID=52560 RepID=A0A1I3W6K4_9BACT|nr:HDOD domain-containing protein [Desulfomicrobium apsheronum]SFK02086.1 EAL and modified HD-GYP domain-containing signal transduction protein [Desulfomicrobium apsheronum]